MKKSAQMKEASEKTSPKRVKSKEVEVRRYIEEHMEKQRLKAMEGDLTDLCF